jgi:hypothetical protein
MFNVFLQQRAARVHWMAPIAALASRSGVVACFESLNRRAASRGPRLSRRLLDARRVLNNSGSKQLSIFGETRP